MVATVVTLSIFIVLISIALVYVYRDLQQERNANREANARLTEVTLAVAQASKGRIVLPFDDDPAAAKEAAKEPPPAPLDLENLDSVNARIEELTGGPIKPTENKYDEVSHLYEVKHELERQQRERDHRQ